MNIDEHKRVVDLLAVAYRNIELDVPSIYRHCGPGAETEAGVIRSLEFSLGLMLEAIELSDEPTRSAIAERAAKIEAAIADHRVKLAEWLEVPILIAEGESVGQTKHCARL